MPIPNIVLDHVAVACEHQADAWPRYAGELGGQWIGGGATVGFASAQVRFANGMKVEVLEPYEPERNDFLRRFLDRSGPGPHHLTFKVGDIVGALGLAEAAGYRPVGVELSDPSWKEAFLHPKDAPGVVIQLAQSSGADWGSPRPPEVPPANGAQASLVHVAHAVRDVDFGMALFRDLLGGEAISHEHGTDLSWPGGGVVRLIDAAAEPSVDEWVGDRAGRVHHLAFGAVDPGAVTDAESTPGGHLEVAPANNLDVRLLFV